MTDAEFMALHRRLCDADITRGVNREALAAYDAEVRRRRAQHLKVEALFSSVPAFDAQLSRQRQAEVVRGVKPRNRVNLIGKRRWSWRKHAGDHPGRRSA